MPGRPREFDPAQALASATECFWANGYEAASLSDLLRCMGISRQSAYDTFGDKRQLFDAALAAYADRVGGEMRRILADEKQSPLGRVRTFLRRLGALTQAGDGRGCLLTNTVVELAPHDEKIRAAVSERLRGLEGAIRSNLEAAKKAGELPNGLAPGPAAKLVVVLMQGALVLSKTELKEGLAEAVGQAEKLLCGAPRRRK